jgi:hypothetical protein
VVDAHTVEDNENSEILPIAAESRIGLLNFSVLRPTNVVCG